MAMTKLEVITAIDDKIGECGGSYSEWYVGITEDPEERLNAHDVIDDYIVCETTSSSVAREAEKHFTEDMGTQGGPGGGDDDAVFVYAYKVTSYTNESA